MGEGAPPHLPGVEARPDGEEPSVYAFVALMAFLETGAPPLSLVVPGEWAVLAGGLAANEGRIELLPLIGVTWVASVLGDNTGFFIGRRVGRDFLLRRGHRFGMNRERMHKLDRFFERWGAPAVALGRLVPLVRPCGPFLAGTSKLGWRRFLVWDLLGNVAFAVTFSLLGYLVYETAHHVSETAGTVALVIAGCAIAALFFTRALRRRRQPA
jgi:membrane protein DedA with SNARE-associated domain